MALNVTNGTEEWEIGGGKDIENNIYITLFYVFFLSTYSSIIFKNKNLIYISKLN